MREVKWIKITTSMFEDEKIDFIDSLPEADAILVIWVRLLTLAGKCNANGYIFLTENIPYTDEMLAHKFRRPLNIVRLALDTFRKLGMIEINEKGIYLCNWEKHQNVEGLEKIREQTRKRVQRYREKQKLLECNVTSNVTVTQGNETDIDIEEELEKEKENNYILTDEEEKFLNVLESIKNYPVDREKDLEMYQTMKKRYPELDLIESIKDWAQYKLDKPLKKNSNPRSQINNSFKKYVEWGRNLKKQMRDTEEQEILI